MTPKEKKEIIFRLNRHNRFEDRLIVLVLGVAFFFVPGHVTFAFLESIAKNRHRFPAQFAEWNLVLQMFEDAK